MDKVERLIAIIMMLLQQERVSATEFARLFKVSRRTILRDMETLSLANIPIYAITGVNGGYGIMDTYKVDKRLLTSSDVQHILTALGGLEALFLTEEVTQTIKKMEAMLRPAAAKRAMSLSFYAWAGRAELLEIIKLCQAAMLKHRLVAFDYIDKDGAASRRVVEAYALHCSESSWYLQGFCLQRQDYRNFKLARIEHLTLEPRTFQPRADWAAQANAAPYDPQLVTIKALIAPSIKDQIIERYGRSKLEAYDADYLLATLDVPHSQRGFQFLASFGTQLKIIAPPTYVADFRSYLAQMLANYA